jgi:hypothetical protein
MNPKLPEQRAMLDSYVDQLLHLLPAFAPKASKDEAVRLWHCALEDFTQHILSDPRTSLRTDDEIRVLFDAFTAGWACGHQAQTPSKLPRATPLTSN